jgi:HAD superfamily hydrolase (TIGR01484 family)
MIKLLSTDFDGTLVSHDERPAVSPELFDLLFELRKNGVRWAVNTGRALHHIVEGIEEFRFPIQPDFVLTCEREVFRKNAAGTGWEDFGDWNARCTAMHNALYDKARPVLDEIARFLKSDTRAVPIDDISGVGLIASNDEEMDRIVVFIESLRGRMPEFHYQRNTKYMRFCHAAYSKGTALGELSRLTGIGRDEIFAAGDHHNDIPMLDGKFARWVACPANSADEVKETVRAASGYVAEKNCSAGVVEALHFFSANHRVGCA